MEDVLDAQRWARELARGAVEQKSVRSGLVTRGCDKPQATTGPARRCVTPNSTAGEDIAQLLGIT